MASVKGTDRDWHQWGNENPFFGVLAEPQFLNANLNDESLQEFFDSGERHVERVYSVIRNKLRPDFRAERVLDYGCGVGRLVIPFARRAQTVVGVDVSPGMLALARENCEKRAPRAVRLIHLDELDSLDASSFDLVHSFTVFQHIPVLRGERLLQKLIALIAEGGVGAIHFTFSDTRSLFRRLGLAVRERSRLVHGVLNTMQGRPFSRPMMQMNSYSMSRIFGVLMDSHCTNLYTEFSDHGGFRGAMLYFEKGRSLSEPKRL
jgi:SAM-dependent methyltransferase